MSKRQLKEIRKLARHFLFWFNSDGSPCDGFRFQEQRLKLSKAVGFKRWFNRKFKPIKRENE
jgi:hypothetical protein